MKTPIFLRYGDHRMAAKKSCRQRIEIAGDKGCVWGDQAGWWNYQTL